MIDKLHTFCFKRIFHPVGQGAFFSEHFLLESGKSIFNIVYDCGTKSTKPENMVENNADNLFSCLANDHVDVLFISHLDDDHVNKIKYLIEKEYVDETTIIIMPLYNKEEVLCISLAINKDLTKLFSILKKINSKMLFVEPIDIESLSSSEGERLDLSERFYNTDDISIFDLSGKKIRSSSVLTYKGIWNYRTASLLESSQKEFLDEIKKSVIVNEDDLNRIFSLFKKKNIKGSEDEKKYKEIKRIYDNVGNKIKTSKININSLLLLSYPYEKIDVSHHSYRFPFYNSFDYDHLVCFNYLRFIYVGSCLYTGDTFMGKYKNIDYCDSIIKWSDKYCRNLEFLQVPHHGSRNNYSESFIHDRRYAFAFTNFDSRKNIYDPLLGIKFMIVCRLFFYITEKKESYFMQTLHYDGSLFRNSFNYPFFFIYQ